MPGPESSGSSSALVQSRSAEILERHNRWLFQCVKPLYAEPVVMESADPSLVSSTKSPTLL